MTVLRTGALPPGAIPGEVERGRGQAPHRCLLRRGHPSHSPRRRPRGHGIPLRLRPPRPSCRVAGMLLRGRVSAGGWTNPGRVHQPRSVPRKVHGGRGPAVRLRLPSPPGSTADRGPFVHPFPRPAAEQSYVQQQRSQHNKRLFYGSGGARQGCITGTGARERRAPAGTRVPRPRRRQRHRQQHLPGAGCAVPARSPLSPRETVPAVTAGAAAPASPGSPP